MRLEELLKNNRNLLIDFFSSDCPPCHVQHEILLQVKERVGSDLTIVQVDKTKNPEIFKAFSVVNLPHLKFFKNGKPMWEKSGILDLEEIEAKIKDSNGEF